ncbi:protein kinase domain-containing protein [Actinoplanes sp. CA-030573]|uniref:serine/threonine-protein kinase n=1 Tax=Actinoplanes sp. CA-030573 TaxID=3239898 RepID=UPI003D8F7A46
MSDNVVGGRYHLQRPLGRGATATVWQACDTRLERDAAVKILNARSRADPAALERLRREARSVARLAHDNIVGMYDVDTTGDAAYLVMELVEGRSLTEMLARRTRLPAGEAVSIAAQICDALDAAHAAGVVHRDIKPSNVLVDAAGVVKVCDFGVALLDRCAGEAALTGADAVVGTCQYMAPEQAAGDPVDGRADLYAVGCVLYAMLAGAPPFAADHPIDVLDLHLHEPPVPLGAHRGGLPPELLRLVAELLAKQPADRPATAGSVAARLRAIPLSDRADPGAAPGEAPVAAPTLALPRVTSAARPSPWRRRPSDRTVALAAGAALVVVAATVVSVTLAGGAERPASVAGRPPTPSATAPAATPEATTLAEPGSGPAEGPSGPAGTGPAGTGPAPRAVTVTDRLAALALLIQRRADDGTVRPKAAKSLLRDLRAVAREAGAGRIDEARDRFEEFRERAGELREDGELGGAALPGLDEIAAALRAG